MINNQHPPKDKGEKTSTETNEFDYEGTFKVNYGIFSKEEQENIKKAKILILGVGGVGGIVAIILARSGLTDFVLVDPDRYTENNTNRQIGCFVDTIGEYKAEIIKKDILRINPEATVEAHTKKLLFDELGELIDESGVFVSAADDLAYSTIAIIMAEKRKTFTISQMPSGLTGYIIVFPPDLPRVIDPIDLFGGPKGLPYEELYNYLANPLNKFGRRWYITEGKWRIEWFNKWRKNELLLLPISKWCFKYNKWEGDSLACNGINEGPLYPLTQICPTIWLGASLASLEVLKYLTGKWKLVKAPKMWHYALAENHIKVERFRRRSRLFFKYLTWAFNIKWLGIGQRIRSYTVKQLENELAEMEKQEKEGKEIRLPFMWRHLV